MEVESLELDHAKASSSCVSLFRCATSEAVRCLFEVQRVAC